MQIKDDEPIDEGTLKEMLREVDEIGKMIISMFKGGINVGKGGERRNYRNVGTKAGDVPKLKIKLMNGIY